MSDPTPSMFERRRHALIAGLALLVVAAVTSVAIAVDGNGWPLQAVDERWRRWMLEVRAPWVTSIAEVLDVLGGPFVMTPIRLAVVAVLAWRRRWPAMVAFAVAIVASELCIGPLKALIERPRPPGALVAIETASFPSGHAIAGAVTAIGLVIVFVPATGRRGGWTALAVGFAVLMATSRTYLAAHWLSDVVAGAGIGTGLAVVSSAAVELRSVPTVVAPSRRPDRVVTSISLVATGVACIVALHLLRRDLDPAADRISEYALGHHGALMTVAFVTIGLGLLVHPLVRLGGGWRLIVPICVVVAGIGMVTSAVFPTDPLRSGVVDDTIHSLASAVATVALITAALVWSLLVRDWRGPRAVTATMLAIAGALLGAVSPFLHRTALTGLSQRLLWLVLLSWVVVTAARPLTSTQGSGSALRQRSPSPSVHEPHPSPQGPLARPRGRRRPHRRLQRRPTPGTR